MNFRNLLTAALAATTLVAGFFAWKQYKRASELEVRAAALAKAADDLKAKAQRRASEARARPDGEAAATDGDGERRGGRGDWQNRAGNFRAIMDSPEAAKVLSSQQKAMLDSRYAPLFKSLNLTPDQIAKFKDLLVEKQNAGRDVMNVAREQGLDMRNNRDEIRQLIQQSSAEVDASITALLGREKFAQYQSFDQTQPQRAVTNQLEQRLSYTAEPLSSAQSARLVSLLAQNAPTSREDGGSGNRVYVSSFAGAGGPGGPSMIPGVNLTAGVPLTDQVIDEAQKFLSPGQVGALRQMQSEQADQKVLQELFRAAGGENRGDAQGQRGSRGNRTRGQ